MAPPPDTADLGFYRTDSDANAGGCALYRGFPSETIFYGPSFESRLTTLGFNEARAVILHEMGHFLSLDHTNFPLPATIMTQGSCDTPAAVTNLTDSDA